MSIITEYTEYLLSSPDFFIEYIQEALGLRDLHGLTNKRIEAITVKGEHPLAMIAGEVLNAAGRAGASVNMAGFLPAVSVVEGAENEESTTMGGGRRGNFLMNMQVVTAIRAYTDMKVRMAEGLITDAQLGLIEAALRQQAADLNIALADACLIAEVEGFWQREEVLVSLWTHNIQERQIIGRVLRSIVYRMRRAMRARRVVDISMRTEKGLVNFNFGRTLHGQETPISFLNHFWTVTVTSDRPMDANAMALAMSMNFTLRPLGKPQDAVVVSNNGTGGWVDEDTGE